MKIPNYIMNEIDEYIEEIKTGKPRVTTYENIIAFINLAQMTGKITEEESIKIKTMVKNINNKNPLETL